MSNLSDLHWSLSSNQRHLWATDQDGETHWIPIEVFTPVLVPMIAAAAHAATRAALAHVRRQGEGGSKV